MIETIILEEPSARRRFRVAPCLEERERYLFHLMRRGFGPAYLRTVSFFLLWIIEFLRLTTLRMVEPEEIERAALASAAYRGPDRRGVKATGNTTVRFPRVAKNWLRFQAVSRLPPLPCTRTKRRLQTSVISCVRPRHSRPRRLTHTDRERS